MSDIESRIDIVAAEFWGRAPYEELRWLRENAPVWHQPGTNLWAVSTYDLVKEVSKNPADFSSAGGIRPDTGATPMMIDLDDPEHKWRRKLMSKGFTPRRVREREDFIRATAAALIDDVAERGECDLVRDLAAWLPLIVIAQDLGIEAKDHARLLEISDDLISTLGQDGEAPGNDRTSAAFEQYVAWATERMYARRENPTDDLISIISNAEVDGERLDDASVLFDSLLVLIGGDETTRHVISGGVHELLKNRDKWEQLRADRTLLPAAVEEMLRFVSPIVDMARTTTRDVCLGGVDIPAGDKVVMLYPSANRDEAVFADPDTFDIARSPNDHVAFGFGSHFCMGASLARLEIRVMLEELLDRLPDLVLASDEPPPRREANFVVGLESIPVEFSPVVPAET